MMGLQNPECSVSLNQTVHSQVSVWREISLNGWWTSHYNELSHKVFKNKIYIFLFYIESEKDFTYDETGLVDE